MQIYEKDPSYVDWLAETTNPNVSRAAKNVLKMHEQDNIKKVQDKKWLIDFMDQRANELYSRYIEENNWVYVEYNLPTDAKRLIGMINFSNNTIDDKFNGRSTLSDLGFFGFWMSVYEKILKGNVPTSEKVINILADQYAKWHGGKTRRGTKQYQNKYDEFKKMIS